MIAGSDVSLGIAMLPVFRFGRFSDENGRVMAYRFVLSDQVLRNEQLLKQCPVENLNFLADQERFPFRVYRSKNPISLDN
jgi:hypothetical protein